MSTAEDPTTNSPPVDAPPAPPKKKTTKSRSRFLAKMNPEFLKAHNIEVPQTDNEMTNETKPAEEEKQVIPETQEPKPSEPEQKVEEAKKDPEPPVQPTESTKPAETPENHNEDVSMEPTGFVKPKKKIPARFLKNLNPAFFKNAESSMDESKEEIKESSPVSSKQFTFDEQKTEKDVPMMESREIKSQEPKVEDDVPMRESTHMNTGFTEFSKPNSFNVPEFTEDQTEQKKEPLIDPIDESVFPHRRVHPQPKNSIKNSYDKSNAAQKVFADFYVQIFID